MSAKILVVDDEPAIVYALQTLLSREGFYVITTNGGVQALDLLREDEFDMLLTDIHMEPMNGIELLEKALEIQPDLAIVTITAYGSVDSAMQAMRCGAFDYVTKPFRFDVLIKTVRHALEDAQMRQKGAIKTATPQLRYYYRQLVGDSSVMRRIYQVIDSMAGSSQPIAIIGEAGVGKTLIAWVIHCRSSRPQQPYVQIDCGSSVEWLQDRIVKQDIFRETQGGSLLLENIHKLDKGMQKLLLKYLKAREFILDQDGNRVARDTRLILTTERDPHQMVQRSEFVEELYYQMAAAPIDVPPLRDRIEDMPLLVQHFLNQFEKKENTHLTLGSNVLQAMEAYSWPGNLQELRDALFVAGRASQQGRIQLDDLPTSIRQLAEEGDEEDTVASMHRWESLRAFLKSKENEYAKHLLELTEGDLQQVAEILELDVEELNKLKEQQG